MNLLVRTKDDFAKLAPLLRERIIGIYGVVSYSVSLRTREIGVRVAMGVQKKNVTQLVVGHGLRLAIVGISFGLICAFSLSKFLASLLYGVSPRDPWIFIGITTILAATSILACWLPARRATKVDPLVALRYE